MIPYESMISTHRPHRPGGPRQRIAAVGKVRSLSECLSWEDNGVADSLCL